jgi:DNA-binding NtrC family response regulator
MNSATEAPGTPVPIGLPPATVLVVDDDALVRWSVKDRLAHEGIAVCEAIDAAEALEQTSEAVDLILLDYRLPDADGLTVLKTVKKQYPDVLVVLMTAHSTIDTAVEAIRSGAYHYITKPFDIEELTLLVHNALEGHRLRREVKFLRGAADREYGLDAIVGASPAMREVKALLRRIAESPASTVLLIGETGTGKDLAAKTLHYNSSRAQRPFVNITCSAIPEQLLESELFGHERGAFTDARQQKRGLFEIADGGTVFLDEIGEMTPTLQAKLLRVLEDKTFKRVGGLQDIRVDVRVIAATHRDLAQAVRDGRFREDLFYRLNVMPIHLPPLRQRAGDIPLLARCFVDGFNREFKKRVRGVADKALALIERDPWPGNVRELRNAIERAMLLTDGEWLQAEDFAVVPQSISAQFRLPDEGVKLDEIERQFLVQALERVDWNQTSAARLLGINRDQVRYRMEKFGLHRPGGRTRPAGAAEADSAPQ